MLGFMLVMGEDVEYLMCMGVLIIDFYVGIFMVVGICVLFVGCECIGGIRG